MTLLLAEILRVSIGTETICKTEEVCLNGAGVALLIYGILLMVFIVFLPKGVVGPLADWWHARSKRVERAAATGSTAQ
jgi:ABC-type branched-subunit amino acid transport system permease subunit